MLIDAFLYNGENDLLKIRLGLLYNFFDYFVIVESTITFTGILKKPVFDIDNFKEYSDKIVYILQEDDININILVDEYISVCKQYKLSPISNGDIKYWTREYHQRENGLQLGLSKLGLNDDDIIFLSDVDEIPDPNSLSLLETFFNQGKNFRFMVFLMDQLEYTPFYRKQKGEVDGQHWLWRGVTVARYMEVKNGGFLNYMREARWLDEECFMISKKDTKDSGIHCHNFFKDVSGFLDKQRSFSHAEDKVTFKDGKSKRYMDLDITDIPKWIELNSVPIVKTDIQYFSSIYKDIVNGWCI